MNSETFFKHLEKRMDDLRYEMDKLTFCSKKNSDIDVRITCQKIYDRCNAEFILLQQVSDLIEDE
jgi:hypothetical protein